MRGTDGVQFFFQFGIEEAGSLHGWPLAGMQTFFPFLQPEQTSSRIRRCGRQAGAVEVTQAFEKKSHGLRVEALPMPWEPKHAAEGIQHYIL
jgi:hypothetical protein